MKYIVEKNFMVLKVDQKDKVDLYTLIDLESGDKTTAVGNKSPQELNQLDIVRVSITINVKQEKIETKNEGDKYIQLANVFVSSVKKLNE